MRWWVQKPVPCVELVTDEAVRVEIYKARHQVYALELGQYPANSEGQLKDDTDAYNHYIVGTVHGTVAGFIAITPPGHRKAMEKHQLSADPSAYELRLLTVLKRYRGQGLSNVLMYAAIRFVEASGGDLVDVCARKEVVPLYQAVGLSATSSTTYGVGAVQYVHMRAPLARIRAAIGLRRPRCTWKLPMGMEPYQPCVHGGAGLDTLSVDPSAVNSDVLDAWFPPPPGVLESVTLEDLRTTPPARASDLVDALSSARGVPPETLVLGAGSSDLIYRAFYAWLTPASSVLLVTPTYAEYEHILKTIGCAVTACALDAVPAGHFDLAVVVNPNSPTGVYTALPPISAHRIWVDETYIDYMDASLSLEREVLARINLVVCKSMSKAYGLSGMRVGYLCSHPVNLESIRARTPPWIVSRVAQKVAVHALRNPEYYLQRYRETADLRARLTEGLRRCEWQVTEGSVANFVLCRPPFPLAPFLEFAARSGVHLRTIDERTLRIAVQAPAALHTIMRTVEAWHKEKSDH